MNNQFRPPRKVDAKEKESQKFTTIDDSCSSTEDLNEDSYDTEIEGLIREEAQLWLATHGPKLFALESSKFYATEVKRSKKSPPKK